jgi:hypothetical protein
MKKILSALVLTALLFANLSAQAQDEDKSKRPSPPAKAVGTLASGAVITIDYSQPSLKGRTMGKDVEPMPGQVWRAGANEATVFAVSKPVMVEGNALPAGKYAFFTIDNGKEWTLIFNKTSDQMGAFNYKEADDALRVKVSPVKSPVFFEKLAYNIDKSGEVSLNWGNTQVTFFVK